MSIDSSPKAMEGRRPSTSPVDDDLPAATRAFFLTSRQSLGELQAFQRLHDQAFHRDVMAFPLDKQVEHSLMHLTKLAGLLADVCEKKHHGEPSDEQAFVEQRIADLLVFALKLANVYDVDLEESYKRRLLEVEKKRIA